MVPSCSSIHGFGNYGGNMLFLWGKLVHAILAFYMEQYSGHVMERLLRDNPVLLCKPRKIHSHKQLDSNNRLTGTRILDIRII